MTNLTQIEEKLKLIAESPNKETLIYDFLTAYNTAKSAISRLKSGSLNMSKNAGEILWKKKLFYKEVFTDELQTILPSILKDKRVSKSNIRFIIITDHTTLNAYDIKTNESIETKIEDIANHVTFFLPLAGMEKYSTQAENDADVKAAVQMAKLFDEIKKTNSTNTPEEVHNLNVFLSRLLFCFFAEDTGIFKKNLFTSSINNHTQQDGSDLNEYLQQLFNVLNTEHRPVNTPTYLNVFPYVNGGLFSSKSEIPLPNFTFKSRKAIIDSGGEYWAEINPDIFGSMIQAVVTPDQRGSLGMHYTSVPNIMKVIKPLFLDELYQEFEAAKHSVTGLNKLLNRIANIRIFDPACGSGNFLIIAYKELRYLEIKILLQLKALQTNSPTGFEEKQPEMFAKQQLSLADTKPQSYQMEMFSRIELNHFFGIELDDFAHEVAKLSLWLAQHQMNMEFNKHIGSTNPSLPLRDAGVIVQGNATRLNWEDVCPKPKVGEVFILGNPPYLGARNQDKQQKEDMGIVFNWREEYKDSDYIVCWLLKGAEYIVGFNAKYSFVSTNSICQGEQVAYCWTTIFEYNLEIGFAHSSFKWTNNAKANAGVTCVIVGVQNISKKEKYIFTDGIRKQVDNISPYLTAGANIFVKRKSEPLTSVFPQMVIGSMARDGGNLIISKEEKDFFLDTYPFSDELIRKLYGSQEFIQGTERWCFWISDEQLEIANTIPELKDRIKKVYDFRIKSTAKTTNVYATIPHKFAQRCLKETDAIIVPSTSSENRNYIPIGFLNNKSVITNSANAIYDAKPFMFGIISSKMHNVWVRAVGGQLETRLRYSTEICYNTFPFPPITPQQKTILEQHTHNILEQRAKHTDKTLAELYDPEEMPEGLCQAHKNLDIAIEKCYRDKPFENDEERLAHLFKLYEQMIEEEKTKGTLFAAEPKQKKSKKK
jgi:type II restriction/modification system DNA methylase subunit YeeA